MAHATNHPSDKLTTLHILLQSGHSYISPEEQNTAKLDIFLKLYSESTDKAQERLISLIAKTKGQQRLQTAKIQRERILKLRDHLIASVERLNDNSQDIANRLINAIDHKNSSEIAILARKFEQSAPDDLRSLKEDIAWLEELAKDKKSASKDK
jgi:hypothetical protein